MGDVAQAFIPRAGVYGRQDAIQDHGDGTYGSNGLRDEAWAHQSDNDVQQQNSASNAGYAQNAAQTGAGMQRASTDPRLAAQEAAARAGHQNSAIGLAGTLARGSMPSAGAMQLQRGLNQATAQQSAIAAGARGSAALATSQASRQANVANLQQNAYTNAGILRANEMAAGRGLYGSLASQQRDQDASYQQQQNQLAQFNAQEKDKYTVGMAGMATGYGQLGNQQQQGDQAWMDMGQHSVDAQSQMEQERQRWLEEARQSIGAQNRENQ